MVGFEFIYTTLFVKGECCSELHQTHKVSVEASATDLVTSRLAYQYMTKASEERTHKHHRAAQARTEFEELIALKSGKKEGGDK